tara:strand:- start:484 stop:1143 length:660 start_codon:yes stop_codon:yes gene_type:complete
MNHHILYSFRRCPYAIRARWALLLTQTKVICREVNLKDKPKELLDISPKGTVPVLITDQGEVIDESISIILWALDRNQLRSRYYSNEIEINNLILQNDNLFKYHLDRCKYPLRFPANNSEYHRTEAISILKGWNELLSLSSNTTKWLVSGNESLADWSLWPFVKQFRSIDPLDFDNNSNFYNLKIWLDFFLNNRYFDQLMAKGPFWHKGDPNKYFPNNF